MHHLLNQHITSNLRRRHVSNLQQKLGDPVSNDWKQCHKVFDYLGTGTNTSLGTSDKTCHTKTSTNN